jgi:hypothetical protein
MKMVEYFGMREERLLLPGVRADADSIGQEVGLAVGQGLGQSRDATEEIANM